MFTSLSTIATTTGDASSTVTSTVYPSADETKTVFSSGTIVTVDSVAAIEISGDWTSTSTGASVTPTVTVFSSISTVTMSAPDNAIHACDVGESITRAGCIF